MYLTQGLHRAAQQNSRKADVIFGDRRMTYLELRDRVARLAGALQGLGVKPGDRVAMLANNSHRFVEYYFGVLWAGGVVSPVNVRWSPEEILYSLGDCGPEVLIVDDAHLDLFRRFQPRAISLREVIHASDGPAAEGLRSYEDLVAAAEPVGDARRGGDELAAIFYTGGTTGLPKGVMLSHSNLGLGALAFQASERPPGAVSLHMLPMFHAGGLMMLLAQLGAAHRHVILERFDALEAVRAIQDEKVTDVFLVPAMLQMIIEHPAFAEHDVSSMRTIWYGGSMAGEALFDRLHAAFPTAGFNQLYAMTEAPTIALLPPSSHSAEARRGPRIRSTGRPTAICEVRVVDEEGRDLAHDTLGEILVRGPNVMLGYWNKPEETAAVLRDGWLHTGDGGKIDADGFIYILDRIKDMIRTGGENVYAAEVENVLATHPIVQSCAVIGIPDARMGEAIHAILVPKPGVRRASLEDLQAHCRTRLAGYKLPRSVEYRDALPLSGVGKVLKRDLRAPFWASQSAKVGG